MSRGGAAIARIWALAVLSVVAGSLLLVAGRVPAATAAPAVAGSPARVVMILLDTNNSPSYTSRLAAERRQALDLAQALPPDVRVGVVFFSDTARVVLAPTASRTRLASALTVIHPEGATSNGLGSAMTDATAEINRLGASPANSRMLVLSDAEDLIPVSPTGTVPVDAVVSYYDGDDYPSNVRKVVEATHGKVVSAAAVGSLAAAFPPLPSPTPTVSKTRQAQVPAPAAPAPAWHLTNSLMIILALVFVILLFLAWLALRALRPSARKPDLVRSIGRYGPQRASARGAASQAQSEESQVARRAVGLMSRLLKTHDTEPKLAQRLDRAGISRSPAEWALLGVSVSVVLAAAVTVLTNNLLIGLLVGVAGGWAGMRLALSTMIARRGRAFDEQLPNILQLVASSIQAGFSLAQALDAVVRENAQPASGEFARAIAETRIGIDLADALDAVALRLRSRDLSWVVMAIRIQRETGGNLAEVLRNTVTTMRERSYLRRQVRSLSAEGRLSAYVLLSLPVLVGGWLFFADPSYMRPLYETFLGLAMLVGGIVLISIGTLWMRSLIKVEV